MNSKRTVFSLFADDNTQLRYIKILHVSPSFWPATVYGGPTFSLYFLVKKQAELNHRVDVFSTTANGKAELPVYTKHAKYINERLRVFYFKRQTKDHSHLSVALLWKLAKELKNYDVVHIHGWWNLVSMLSLIVCIVRKKRAVISLRGMLSDYTFSTAKFKSLFHRFIGKHLLRKAIIHTTSRKEFKECYDRIGRFQGFTLPNYIAKPSVTQIDFPEKKLVAKPLTLVTLSRIDPVKNLEFIFNILAKSNIDCHLHIIGEGNSDYVAMLKKKADTMRIKGAVNWLGKLSGPDKYQALCTADVFIQSSFTENFGNAVLEAASVGLPVVIANTIGAADYIKEFNLGHVVSLEEKYFLHCLDEINRELSSYHTDRLRRITVTEENFVGSKLAKLYTERYIALCTTSKSCQ